MFVRKLKYKLVSLGEREFDFTDKKKVIIKGRNYSGKTVTLGLISPFAITKDFLFGKNISGLYSEKEIEIEHNNNVFVLYSKVTSNSVKCSFKIDDKEYCTNGKLTYYNSLLKEYGLDDYPDIINQRSSYFFDLSRAERKKYIQENYIRDYGEINSFIEFVKDKYKNLSYELNMMIAFMNENDLEELEKLNDFYQKLKIDYNEYIFNKKQLL